MKHLAATYGPPLLLGLCIASTLATIWFGLNTIVDFLFWLNGAELPRPWTAVLTLASSAIGVAAMRGFLSII